MVIVEFGLEFEKNFKKVKNQSIKTQIKKQIRKIISNPEIRKPMRYERKNTREFYVVPYRLAYSFIYSENKIVFIDLYHKHLQ